MNKLFTASVLAVAVLAPVAAQATVVIEHADAISWHQTFKDPVTGLIWTNANVLNDTVTNFSNSSSSYVTYSDAVAFVDNLSIGGITNWMLPTRAQFEDLYRQQGSAPNGLSMNAAPFSFWGNTGTYDKHMTEYWTRDSNTPGYHLTFQRSSCFDTCATKMFHSRPDYIKLDVWAVASVPEPETYAMLLAGLGVMGAVARRRQKKQA